MDGNEKILVKWGATEAPSKRAGRPTARNGDKRKPFSNGWFMVTDPSNGRILSIEYMHEPECN